jgi:serine/threonine protein phosphatase PrpC
MIYLSLINYTKGVFMQVNNNSSGFCPLQDSDVVSNNFALSGDWGYLLIGGVLASVAVTVFVKNFFFDSPTLVPDAPWKPRALTIDVAAQKMWNNSKKAIEEHHRTSSAYATLQEALPCVDTLINPKPKTSLSFEHFSDEAQGPRKTMEDVHFVIENDQGLFAGVFDGHGGKVIADYASSIFQKQFFEKLNANQGNVHQTFEILCDEIQNQVAKNIEWYYRVGTTAVICFIDKRTHLIYTATLGDSEANIYRKIDKQVKSIPLSCIRNWSSKKDAKRAAIALEMPEIAINWPKVSQPKGLRFPYKDDLNVSRAFGDVHVVTQNYKTAIIHKPKITINQINPGDTLILACDGLKDYVPENEIIDNLTKDSTTNLAKKLVDYALTNKTEDNVTVIVVNVK